MKRSQQGMGTMGFLIFLMIVGFLTYLVLQIVPIYMQDYTLKHILESAQTQTVLKRSANVAQGTLDLRDYLTREFRVNDVNDVPLNNVHLSSIRGGYTISIVYDSRKNVIGNLDVVAHFEHQITVHIS